ncbi:sensor domain-containing protein [Streptomyces sp. NBC_01476]|uniref:sensor domain-containing protein n=1 Tax=Streptomyces sp. NBC_01476 TaxID=2903881 RepID=UPI002E30D002|nr:sensor domain-containing protein [Streptomyces sp. NBC_01476]
MPIPARSRLLAGSRTGRRTALAAVALLPALALTAGCGGGDKKPGPVKASGAVPAAALTRALLTSSDLAHVQSLPAGDKSLLLGGAQKPDKPDCQPVADQWTTQPKHPRQVYAGAMLTDTADPDKNAKTISLDVIASYKKGEAQKVLDELTESLRTCHGYQVVRNGATTTFAVKQVPQTGAPLGDQQVSYTIGDVATGAKGTVLVTVVRTGDATASYETVRADHKAAALRLAIPLKQAEKLEKAAAGG